MRTLARIITITTVLALTAASFPDASAAPTDPIPTPASPSTSEVILPDLDQLGSDSENGLRQNAIDTTAINSADYFGHNSRVRAATNLPESYDLRATHPTWVNSVRDQGQYGSCWAFASTASGESALQKNSLAPAGTQLSPAHLVFSAYNSGTHKRCPGTNSTFPNCTGTEYEKMLQTGGNAWIAASTWSSWRGPQLESAYPYPSVAGIKGADLTKTAYRLNNMYVFPSPWVENGSSYTYNAANIDVVKSAIYNYGALYTSYLSFQISNVGYETIFNPVTSAQYDHRPDQEESDHAVTIVGWDDNFAKTNFKTTPPGNGAFLIRNSWGDAPDHIDGYFWLSYYDSTIKESTYFDLGTASDGLSHNYLHDELGWISQLTFKTATAGSIANVFTVTGSTQAQSLDQIMFVAASPNMQYSVKIYKDVIGSDPESGKLQAITANNGTQISGQSAFAGIYTLRLPKPVIVRPGSRFSVVIQTSPTTSNFQLPVELASTIRNETATIGGGQSYYKYSTAGWYDLHDLATTRYPGRLGNISIKASTSDPVLTSVGMDGGQQTSYVAGAGFNYASGQVILTYSNGATEALPLNHSSVTVQGYANTVGTHTVTVTVGQLSTSYQVSVAKGQITLNVSGGTKLKNTSYAFSYGQNVKLPTPKRAHYKFLGWYTAKAGGAKIASTAALTQSATLYAHWQGEKHQVKFVANGAKAKANLAKKYVYYGSKYGTLPNATRAKYSFAGWYTKKKGGTKVTAATVSKLTKNAALYAHWKKK